MYTETRRINSQRNHSQPWSLWSHCGHDDVVETLDLVDDDNELVSSFCFAVVEVLEIVVSEVSDDELLEIVVNNVPIVVIVLLGDEVVMLEARDETVDGAEDATVEVMLSRLVTSVEVMVG